MGTMKVLVIGAGKIAERHVRAWKGLGVDRISICDLASEHAKWLADELGVQFLQSPLGAIESSATDVVDICVPTPSHAGYVIGALDAGKHVFVEKPLCSTSSEGEQILATARKSGCHLQVGYLFRYHPVYLQVKDWLEQGLVGQAHLVLGRMGGRGAAALWKHQSAQGGGAINEMLVHKIDLLMWFFGDLKLERALLKKTILPTRRIKGGEYQIDAEDFVVAEFSAQNATVVLQSDLVSPAYVESTEIHGTNGSIVASVQEGVRSYLYLCTPSGETKEGYHYLESGSVDLFGAELADFSGRLAEKPNYAKLEDAVRQIILLEQIRSRC